jgi:hypothetical protein
MPFTVLPGGATAFVTPGTLASCAARMQDVGSAILPRIAL